MFLVDDASTHIKKAVIRSQHVQRNWDLSKEMPQDDIDLLVHAATNCPSKQNFKFYDLHVITNRNTIEEIYKHTKGLGIKNEESGKVEMTTNSQVLAHSLFIFTDTVRSAQYKEKWKNDDDALEKNWMRDQDMAIGIAAGYVNVIASQLGYGTGCCACFMNDPIQEIIGSDGKIVLMMGVGLKDDSLNRRVHHETGRMMHTFIKEPITVHYNK